MKRPPDELVVVSPDEGSINQALGHSKRLGARLAIVDKRRGSAHDTEQENIIGAPVDGKTAIIFDDLISRFIDSIPHDDSQRAKSHRVLCYVHDILGTNHVDEDFSALANSFAVVIQTAKTQVDWPASEGL